VLAAVRVFCRSRADTIRWNIWVKLWGNVCFNPIRVLTLATVACITSGPASAPYATS